MITKYFEKKYNYILNSENKIYIYCYSLIILKSCLYYIKIKLYYY